MSGAGDRITNGWSAPAIERVCVRSSTVPRRVVVRIILMVRRTFLSPPTRCSGDQHGTAHHDPPLLAFDTSLAFSHRIIVLVTRFITGAGRCST